MPAIYAFHILDAYDIIKRKRKDISLRIRLFAADQEKINGVSIEICLASARDRDCEAIMTS